MKRIKGSRAAKVSGKGSAKLAYKAGLAVEATMAANDIGRAYNSGNKAKMASKSASAAGGFAGGYAGAEGGAFAGAWFGPIGAGVGAIVGGIGGGILGAAGSEYGAD